MHISTRTIRTIEGKTKHDAHGTARAHTAAHTQEASELAPTLGRVTSARHSKVLQATLCSAPATPAPHRHAQSHPKYPCPKRHTPHTSMRSTDSSAHGESLHGTTFVHY
jgi:hypothetical protein